MPVIDECIKNSFRVTSYFGLGIFLISPSIYENNSLILFNFFKLTQHTLNMVTDARDTRSDKMLNATSWMENCTLCHTIPFLWYGVGWNAFRSI